MFENEYKQIAQSVRVADELNKAFVTTCQALGLRDSFDFPGKNVKNAADLAKLMDDKALAKLVELNKKAIENHKLYHEAQQAIQAAWDRFEAERKAAAKKILDELQVLDKQVFDNKRFHPGCKLHMTSDAKMKLIVDAIKIPGSGGQG
jgi:hypothetical protein